MNLYLSPVPENIRVNHSSDVIMESLKYTKHTLAVCGVTPIGMFCGAIDYDLPYNVLREYCL